MLSEERISEIAKENANKYYDEEQIHQSGYLLMIEYSVEMINQALSEYKDEVVDLIEDTCLMMAKKQYGGIKQVNVARVNLDTKNQILNKIESMGES